MVCSVLLLAYKPGVRRAYNILLLLILLHYYYWMLWRDLRRVELFKKTEKEIIKYYTGKRSHDDHHQHRHRSNQLVFWQLTNQLSMKHHHHHHHVHRQIPHRSHSTATTRPDPWHTIMMQGAVWWDCEELSFPIQVPGQSNRGSKECSINV